MGCSDSRAINVKQNDHKNRICQVSPNDHSINHQGPKIKQSRTPEKHSASKPKQENLMIGDKSSLQYIVRQLHGIRNSVNVLENSIRDMRLKQIKLNESNLKKKWKDNLRKKNSSLNLRINARRRRTVNANKTISKICQKNNFFVKKNFLKKSNVFKKNLRTESFDFRKMKRSKSVKNKSLVDSEISSDISNNHDRSSSVYNRTLVKQSFQSHKVKRKALVKASPSGFFKIHKKKGGNRSEHPNQAERMMKVKRDSIFKLAHQGSGKKRRKGNPFFHDIEKDESSISIVSYNVNNAKREPTDNSIVSRNTVFRRKEKLKKPKEKVVTDPDVMNSRANPLKKTYTRKLSNKRIKVDIFNSEDLLKKYDENCQRYHKKKALLQKQLKEGKFKKISIQKGRNSFKKDMGKLYGGVTKKKARKMSIDNSNKMISSSKSRSKKSKKGSSDKRRAKTPKIPVSKFSKMNVVNEEAHSPKKSRKSRTIHDFTPQNSSLNFKRSLSKLSHTTKHIHRRLGLKQNSNLMNHSLQKSPTHTDFSNLVLSRNLMDKERELEKELNKSNLHCISIDNSPAMPQMFIKRQQARENHKKVLLQIGNLFKKLNQDSDESRVLSSIRKRSSKNMIKFDFPLIEPVKELCKGSSSSGVSAVSSVAMTTILDKTIDAEGIENINQYRIIGVLGRGAFGEVKKVKSWKDKRIYAMKIINIKGLEFKNRNSCMKEMDFKQEITLQSLMSHKNILRIVEVIDNYDDDHIYIILEYAKLGSICSKKFWRGRRKISKLAEGKEQLYSNQLTITQIKDYFSQLILGLDYLHSTLKIAHRDIKPENVLVMENDVLKIADFGVSQSFRKKKDDLTNKKIGTTALHPPEIIKNQQFNAFPCDIWAAGCTLYYMVTGNYPFRGRTKKILQEKICNCEYKIPEGINPDLLKVLEMCLNVDVEERATTKSLLENSWLFPDVYSKMNTLVVN